MNKFAKEFFILIKDDCLRLLNDNIEWKPETICKMPYGQPIVHALFVDDNRFSSADTMLMMKEFKAIYPKSIFKGNLYICIPDDYSSIETTAIREFLLMTKCTNRVFILYYSQCIGIKYEITEYIAITATKRCIALNNIKQGVLKEIEFLSWQDGKENIQKVLINWGNKPVYLCDPNHLLEDYVSFGIDKIDITEDIFLKLKNLEKTNKGKMIKDKEEG